MSSRPKKTDPNNLNGRIVRGADGRTYVVTMDGNTSKPWGRERIGERDGEFQEIPRPISELKQ